MAILAPMLAFFQQRSVGSVDKMFLVHIRMAGLAGIGADICRAAGWIGLASRVGLLRRRRLCQNRRRTAPQNDPYECHAPLNSEDRGCMWFRPQIQAENIHGLPLAREFTGVRLSNLEVSGMAKDATWREKDTKYSHSETGL